jgi:glycosyltransferase involved in cell wall biosynthesis
VWEAEQWGVRRPGWSRALERFGEAPSLRRASIVCCGTDIVAEQALRLGTPPDRILVTPTGVDTDLFADMPDPGALRTALGLDDRFVIGWVGSFRGFHALELLVAAAADLPKASLLFVGDGPERARIEGVAREAGVHAVFTGTVAHTDVPLHLAAMDVAAVVAAADEVFHYSPLKLAEYLAAGRAVVAPAVPQLTARLHDRVDARLVPPGDDAALRAVLHELHDDPDERRRLGRAARAEAAAGWSWDVVIRTIVDRIPGRAAPT